MPNVEKFSTQKARLFAQKYADAKSEKQLAQSFWRDFFVQVCEVDDLLSAGIEFEYPVKSQATKNTQFVDVLWPGILLVEHKSAGKSLDKAEEQARDYLVSLDASKRSPVFIVSDFARIRIVEVFAGTSVEFPLDELPNHLHRIEAILSRYTAGVTRLEVTADRHAAELMSRLFVEFEKAGYTGHAVSIFLVRLLFLLFGDDTHMWKRTTIGLFENIVDESPKNGTGLGGVIQELFQVLNTPTNQRPTSLPTSLRDFPYVNGGIFAEALPTFSFTPDMRSALYEATKYDWSSISPAIFGAMFQTIKSKEERRELGEHYTSELNILKVIGPLFLADFNDRLHQAWESPADLKRFHQELGEYSYLDPACGCGNFLVVAYKRLRELELKLIARLQELEGKSSKLSFDGSAGLKIHLGQFYGIEYEEWPSQIATVAMFLADHQANLAMEEITGLAPHRFPLTETAHITNENALRVVWSNVCPINDSTFIMGNPPFYGARWQNPSQKQETLDTWKGVKGAGDLDYVTNWFLIAAKNINSKGGRAAFVATNSITQGGQPATIWGQLSPLGMGIDFAHRTFAWQNDASGMAAVHCVVVGFSSKRKPPNRKLWKYLTPNSEPVLSLAKNINAYLLDARDILITPRATPLLPSTSRMDNGSMPNDGGFLSSISEDEANSIRKNDVVAAKYLRRLVGGQELLHDDLRYCLWLVGVSPSEIRSSSELSKRVAAVKKLRETSKRSATQKLAHRAAEFGENRQPKRDYLAIPVITSELRDYVPIARLSPEIIINNKVSYIEDGSFQTFGLISSKPFNVWNKGISGRTKNDTVISNSITYNNFPFPHLSASQEKAISIAAENVLEIRSHYPKNSLADLYDKTSMPEPLYKAHQALDRLVLEAYGLKHDASDEAILTLLFEMYADATKDLFSTVTKGTKKRKLKVIELLDAIENTKN